MNLGILLASILISTTNLSITEPIDGETYDGDWLTVRAIVENENEIPDSVSYSLNGEPVAPIPRLNTDWPTYMQNYQRHGYSDSPAPHTSEILWTAPICGEMHEFPTPAVVNGTVFYPQDGIGVGDTLFALNSATGSIKWFYPVGYTDDTVTLKNGLLYSASDSLYCLDAETGARIWAWGDDAIFHQTGSPIVTNGIVYFATSHGYDTSRVYAADAASGLIIWETGFSGALETSLAYFDNTIYIALYTDMMGLGDHESLFALDASSGSILWSNDHTDGGYWDSSPNIYEGMLYIGGDDGYLHAFDAGNGVLVWEEMLHPASYLWGVEPTPAIHDDQLFIGCCFWGTSFGYVGAHSRVTGSEIWSIVDRMELHGSFGLAEDLAFMGANLSDSIFAFDQASGEIVWSYGYNGSKWDGCQSSPSITDGVMYIPATDGNLYAFGTGLKFTYLDDLFADIGANELIATSYFEGVAVATDTICFTVTGTGIELYSSTILQLGISPNPFHSAASISFELAEPGRTIVSVYDLSGRIVKNLVNSELGIGQHSVSWDGTGENGEILATGIYMCRIEFGGISETTSLCLLR